MKICSLSREFSWFRGFIFRAKESIFEFLMTVLCSWKINFIRYKINHIFSINNMSLLMLFVQRTLFSTILHLNACSGSFFWLQTQNQLDLCFLPFYWWSFQCLREFFTWVLGLISPQLWASFYTLRFLWWFQRFLPSNRSLRGWILRFIFEYLVKN